MIEWQATYKDGTKSEVIITGRVCPFSPTESVKEIDYISAVGIGEVSITVRGQGIWNLN